MPKISQQTIDNIKNKVSLSQYISRYADVKHKRGSDYVCCCPFHDEKTPSFYIHDDKQYFHCFGCGVSGDVFKFVSLYDHLSWYEAIIKIADEIGEPLDFDTNQTNSNYKKKSEYLALYERSRIFMNNLLNSYLGKKGLTYLSNRNINQQMIDKFSLGYLPQSSGFLYNRIKASSDYKDELLNSSGIFYQGSKDSLFDGRLIFPVRTWDGKTVAFSARDLTGLSKAKYRNSPETLIYSKKNNLFGIYESLEALKSRKEVVICEGNFDVIALHQADIDYAVASLGTAFTPEQARLLARYVDHAIVLFDNDEAGIKATVKTLAILQAQGISNSVVNLQEFNDPAEMLEKKGADTLKKALTSKIEGFMYLVNNAIKLYDIKNSKGKDQIFQYVKPYIDATSSEIEKDALLQRLAEMLKVHHDSVLLQYKKENSNKRTYGGKESVKLDILPLTKNRFNLDLFLMLVVVNNRKHFKQFRKNITVNDLNDEEAISLFNILEDYFRLNDEDCGNDYFLQLIKDPQIKADVSSSYYMEEFKEKYCILQIKEGINRIRLRSLEAEKKRYEEILELAQSSNDIESIKTLLKDQILLDQDIAELRGQLVPKTKQ
ncbi:MAG: DNA primase [Sphaerochaetaceae bacterium]|nr:DNA primase [Sphaerochaetaceae bacterium]